MSTWEVPDHVRAAAARVTTVLPGELVEQALTRYVAGVAPGVIGDELGISDLTVNRWRRVAGLPASQRGQAGLSRLDLDEQRRRRTAIEAHGTINAAALALGMNPSVLWRWADRTCPDLISHRRRPTADRPCHVLVPVEPLALWLDEQLARGAVIEDLAARARVDPRRVNAIKRREYATVSLANADALLTAAGVPLALVYPPELEPVRAA